jgi:hypothetical protein
MTWKGIGEGAPGKASLPGGTRIGVIENRMKVHED